MFAARNIKLCTKDCACLMVCPTGATDTENGQIDEAKCIDGCRLCVDACPSHAIYLVYTRTAEKKRPSAEVTEALSSVLKRVAEIHYLAGTVSEPDGATSRFLKALRHSTRVLGEDCYREQGHLSLDPRRAGGFTESADVLASFTQSFGNTDAVRKIAASVTEAIAKGHDAEAPTPVVCGSCGHIVTGGSTDVCPKCGAALRT